VSWPAHQVQALGAAIDQGLSAGEFARTVDMTRSAVIAKAARCGWHFGKPRASRDLPAPKPSHRPPPRGRAPRIEVGIQFDRDTAAQIAAFAASQGVKRTEAIRTLMTWGLEGQP